MKNKTFFDDLDQKFSYKKSDLGVKFLKDKIQLKLWQPIAKKVEVLVFDKTNFSSQVATFKAVKKGSIWFTFIPLQFECFYYQYKIFHNNNKTTFALDPYAISLAPFNWQEDENKVGLGALINKKSAQTGQKPKKLVYKNNNHVDVNIYELHIRDFTSLKNQNEFLSKLGTFDAAIEANLFSYVKKLGFSHIQLLPIASAFSVNDLEQKMIYKSQASKWSTNYNWGYDPHNYFSINGIYSSNPKDPYARIKEFKKFVSEAHKNNIGIILDVVYNHLMTNNILNNIIDGYYFRNEAKIKPVKYPPLADQRLMTKKLILDSLKYFVQEFNVDGFRFDLSCFMHKETINEIVTELRKLNPNLVFHGEAWPFTDLEFQNSYIKGTNSNNLAFAYFNDTIRDSIKGSEHSTINSGLIIKQNEDLFVKFVSSIVGNIKDFNFKNITHSKDDYFLFAEDISMVLNYAACHDGFTLWDKINVSAKANLPLKRRIEIYRQALMMSVFSQGRHLMLAGTELLQSKPCDNSGEEPEKCVYSTYDDFNEQPDNSAYHPNSYKTSDYTNGLKWTHLKNELVKQNVFNFVSKLNKYRAKTRFFRLATNKEIKDNIKFLEVDKQKAIIAYQIKQNNEVVEVIHNFSEASHFYKLLNKDKVLFSSRIKQKEGILEGQSSILIKRNYENN
ncbi:alpha-amylase family glycosyl hydrolase [Mycoplasma sp. 1654_15]|uniref:alpha-amylase family glycosyl hydrolase n=1 Tax=Mycoplasma sp. 1654_15 TaxID=2725994 RepID=UPI0014492837|nr:alpha-amylase family glycosyl hydrolase [Mycoplasma sp. 1654_15]QJB71434.1 alpha-amylase [Mycoplasma sp. 1654_15]